MFPWNYGFAWDAGHIVFLGAFYSVLLVVTATVGMALTRAAIDFKKRRASAIVWRAAFEELPEADRPCRHEVAGEWGERTCPNAFECGMCEPHRKRLVVRPAEVLRNEVDDSLGFDIPLDRYYHRGHTWARPEAGGTFLIGPDELARRAVGHPDIVRLPAAGARVTRNDVMAKLRAHGNELRMLSPLDGEVVETGCEGGAWYVRVRPDADASFVHLLRGSEATRWMAHEWERVQLMLSTAAGAPALADGGAPMDDLPAACPSADWRGICGTLFLDD
jgi:hypothetical protein